MTLPPPGQVHAAGQERLLRRPGHVFARLVAVLPQALLGADRRFGLPVELRQVILRVSMPGPSPPSRSLQARLPSPPMFTQATHSCNRLSLQAKDLASAGPVRHRRHHARARGAGGRLSVGHARD